MAKLSGGIGLVCLLAGSACSSSMSNTEPASVAAQKERTALDDKLAMATGNIKEFRDNMPDSVANEARCVAIIPNMAKVGLVVGGQGGSGFASCKVKEGWSPPAPISLGGGSVGAQLGAESSDWLMLVMTEKAEMGFLTGKFRIGADASATAGPVGRGAGASSDVQGGDTVSYSRSRGLFAGAVLNGATIGQDEDTTRALYGRLVPARSILEGKEPMPADAAAMHFVATVRESFAGPVVSIR